MNRYLTAAAIVGGVLFAATASATTFYIDRFQIAKNGVAGWFDDPFDVGGPPPASESVFPNTNPASYLVVPVPFPGIEANSRVSLDTALGQPQISQITGESILFQRARLNTNTSNDPDDLARGLKRGDEFTVTGLFDLMEPDLARERYGIRLVDFAGGAPNDNLQLTVGLTSQGEWRVQFLEADFDAGLLNELGGYSLSHDIPTIAAFDQIALRLMKAVAGSSQITAGFDLIDLDDPANNISFGLAGGADIFDGELWTQAEFVAVRVVPVPAALPLLVSAIALAGLFGRRDHGSRG